MMKADDNVIALHRQRFPSPPVRPIEDPIVAAVMKLKEQPIRQVNWPAVITFLAISIVAMASAALVPLSADAAIRWRRRWLSLFRYCRLALRRFTVMGRVSGFR